MRLKYLGKDQIDNFRRFMAPRWLVYDPHLSSHLVVGHIYVYWCENLVNEFYIEDRLDLGTSGNVYCVEIA